MSHKITVGLQQKVGQPNYGSLGATCYIELTLSADEAGQATVLTDRIRQAFACCRARINEELPTPSTERPAATPAPATAAQPSIPTSGNRVRGASEAQVRALHAIAAKHGIVLASELEAQFGVTTPADLTIRQASQMIDALKSTAASA